MDNKSILNIENYKTTFMDKNTEIHTQFIILINKYNSIILESISILKHDYFKYIYLKGIESLTIHTSGLLWPWSLFYDSLSVIVQNLQQIFLPM